MEVNKNYIPLKDLEVYKFARELSSLGWLVYNEFDWQTKKIISDQYITSIDSVGANIAEGYARFYYLDKIRFYYNARGSLSEACDHWLELLLARGKIAPAYYQKIKQLSIQTSVKLNNFISSTYRSKINQG